jgi:phosphatidylglycerophosphatase A
MSTIPNWSFMARHPARWLALGFGAGLAPRAPGTVGTLWAWAAFLLIERTLPGLPWGWVIGIGTLIGWWACTRCAQHMGVADPGSIVWDEVLAFWLILWVAAPDALWQQAALFALFRYFDAAKPGPVGWADRAYKLRPGATIGWAQGWGILWDDFVAAGCTLFVWALGLHLWRAL